MNDSPKLTIPLIKDWWPAALIGTMWLWMFWPMISGQTVCGFRDSAYLYYPLFKWIDSVWASGEIPLWNPYCNYGLPVVGDGSSSVFYPGKLIFLCRFLSYPSRYGFYLSVHILVAAAGAYRFARVMKASQEGATLAAISYAFGGSVLFQVTNVIYLVSAAWLPFALKFVWNGVLRSCWRSAVLAGVVCALMILGGDPQMVYHVGLIAAASVISKFWSMRRKLIQTQPASIHTSYGWLLKAGLRLGLMVTVTAGLAAIQILPTAHWAARSDRVNHYEIVNLPQCWKIAQLAAHPEHHRSSPVPPLDQIPKRFYCGVIEAPSTDALSQKNAAYQFSQPPWSIFESFFPNVMGKPFPTHQRWSDSIPGSERIWVPTIYLGVLTVLLAIPMFRFSGSQKMNVWLTRIGVFFTIASFGWFGAVWLINEVLAACGLPMINDYDLNIGPQVGGFYWMMATILPKYFMFRYPAKLFVIASLMISILAARALKERVRFSNRGTKFVAVVSIVGLFTIRLPIIKTTLEKIHANDLFGPFDVTRSLIELNFSFATPLLILALLWMSQVSWISKIATGATVSKVQRSKTSRIVVILLTAIDLLVSNHWLKAEVNANVFERPTRIRSQLTELKTSNTNSIPRVYRNFRVQSNYSDWIRRSSSERLSEIVTWQRETLFPKHHLEHRIALLGSFSSVMPIEDSLNNFNLFRRPRIAKPELMSISGQFTLDPKTNQLQFESSPVESKPVALDIAKFVKRQWQPHGVGFRYVKQFRHHKSKTVSTRRTSNRQLVSNIVVPEPLVGIETNAKVQLENVLADEGWRIVVEDINLQSVASTEVSRDRYTTELPVEPGRFKVTFTYSPQEFWIGMTISLCSLGGLLVLCAIDLNNQRRRVGRFSRTPKGK